MLIYVLVSKGTRYRISPDLANVLTPDIQRMKC